MAARARVAWIGLGRIGLPMAARLAGAGWMVAGYDLSAERRAAAKARGITPAESAGAALDGAGFLFTSLPAHEAIPSFLHKGVTLVETSTISPQASAEIAKAAAAKGAPYLRSPISGSTALAEAGTLTVFASGPKAVLEAARPALAAFSRAQIWLGEGEEARYAKLAVNLMVAVTAGMMGEALALARKGGISWPAILDVIGESAVGSPLVKYKLDPLRRRDFSPAATNSLIAKDLELIVGAANAAGVPVPLAEHMQAAYAKLIEEGFAEEDFFGIVRAVERSAGLGEP
ncbi:MAG TPA: NAD(P)-dependent oxidoreductase [Burkholderiales bacterium]|nr:NAD(P)-dependent oxidoreductase [Burkholderiales bacterium]